MDWGNLLKVLIVVAVVALILAAFVLTLAVRALRRIRVPANADFFTTVRAVPLSLVVGIDLLDLALESFSAPLIWLILNHYGLKALRNVGTIEALIPITGPIPTLTLAWFAARLFQLGQPYDPNVIETRRIGPDRYAPRPR